MAGKCIDDLEESETSSVTAKSGCSEVGGYDCDFVEPPADDLLCKICQYPACEPILTVCCGHNFCNTCLERYRRSKSIDNSSCPYCREKENFKTVLDKKTKRAVHSLKVFCPHKHQGCDWIGELGYLEDHMNKNIGCPFTKLQCSNGCGEVMQRRLVEGHLKSECRLREVNCKYCNTTGSYQWISSSHQEECPKYPVECPNHCEAGHVRREEISGHLEECPLAIVKCKFASVGCKSELKRADVMQHVKEAIPLHMEYIQKYTNERLQKLQDDTSKEIQGLQEQLQTALGVQATLRADLDNVRSELDETKLNMTNGFTSIRQHYDKIVAEKKIELEQLNGKLLEYEKELQSCKQDYEKKLQVTNSDTQKYRENFEVLLGLQDWRIQLSYLHKTSTNVLPNVYVKITEFTLRPKNVRDPWSSQPFYTHDKGYKMCLSIPPNNINNNGYLSVYALLMSGEHDNRLHWPIKGTLKIQLLNQLGDDNHGEPKKITFDGSQDSSCCHRVVAGDKSRFGNYHNSFIHQRSLGHFYKNDTLFFKIIEFVDLY